MKKTDKKLENTIIVILTDVCEQALKDIDGFQWLTHSLNFNDVSHSLKVTCVFDTEKQIAALKNSSQQEELISRIKHQLKAGGITMSNAHKQIAFDSEEACLEENAGRWKLRLGN